MLFTDMVKIAYYATGLGYVVSALDDEGEWKIVGIFGTYEQADDFIDWYANKYPHAIVNLFEPSA